MGKESKKESNCERARARERERERKRERQRKCEVDSVCEMLRE